MFGQTFVDWSVIKPLRWLSWLGYGQNNHTNQISFLPDDPDQHIRDKESAWDTQVNLPISILSPYCHFPLKLELTPIVSNNIKISSFLNSVIVRRLRLEWGKCSTLPLNLGESRYLLLMFWRIKVVPPANILVNQGNPPVNILEN